MQAQQAPTFHQNFDKFLNYLRDSDTSKFLSPKRFTEVLDIDLQTLAKQAHVHRNTIQRAPTSAGIQKYIREALRVLRAASDISGDVEKAIFWYLNNPLPAFGYKTAEQLVSDGRSEDVIRYIESLDGGAVG